MLGLDLGTSRLKALACAPDGTVLGRGAADYQISTPRDGWAETDPGQWWRAARAAVRSAAPAAQVQVLSLAIVGQMHGVVLSTERARVLRPGITWLDRRADAEVGDYLRLPGDLRARLGNAPSAGMAGPILLWLSRNEPEAYRRARWMLPPKDWLRTRLTGEPATDPSDASGTLLYDLGRDGWAAEVAGALGLRTDLLPPIRPSGQAAGALLPAAAGLFGLPPGLPVATGASDTAASLAAARLPAGAALLTIGTGGQWVVPAPDGAGLDERTNLFRSADGGLFRLAGAQNVGVTLDWVRRTLGASWGELYDTAARPWAGRTPVFLPYLAGERWDHGNSAGPGGRPPGAPRAGGAWTGLTLAHQRHDLLRAALEGVAFLLRAKLDDLRAAGCSPHRVVLGGGGSQHPAWRQMLADVLALPLHPAGTGWLTARGAARLAAAAGGAVTGAGTEGRSAENVAAPVRARGYERAEAAYQRFRSARA